MNSFSRIVDILLLVMLLFIAPVYSFAVKQDSINQTVVASLTSLFADAARNKGYIDRQMYEVFIKELEATGSLYDIILEHHKKVYYDNEGEYNLCYEYCNDEITDCIYNENGDGIYKMSIGDLFCVRVKNKTDTLAQKVFNNLVGKNINGIYAVSGGVVRDEAY